VDNYHFGYSNNKTNETGFSFAPSAITNGFEKEIENIENRE